MSDFHVIFLSYYTDVTKGNQGPEGPDHGGAQFMRHSGVFAVIALIFCQKVVLLVGAAHFEQAWMLRFSKNKK